MTVSWRSTYWLVSYATGVKVSNKIKAFRLDRLAGRMIKVKLVGIEDEYMIGLMNF